MPKLLATKWCSAVAANHRNVWRIWNWPVDWWIFIGRPRFDPHSYENETINDFYLYRHRYSSSYILGSSSSISIEYTIENARETAYLAQILVTLPESIVSFMKTPSNCHLVDESTSTNRMLCDVNNRTPLSNSDRGTQVISIDMTNVDGTNLVIKAEVFSTGDEFNDLDNKLEINIPLVEFSDVEVLG